MSMDAARYARIRELFLAAEELPRDDQLAFLRSETREDEELFAEVSSLLREHDPALAKREGDSPSRVQLPPAASAGPQQLSSRGQSNRVTGDPVQSSRSNSARRSVVAGGKLAKVAVSAPTTGESSQSTLTSDLSSSRLWAHQARRSRRRNNKWLWLAALLPTALIGWFTYQRVNSTMEQSVRDELRGIADSVSHASRRFLVDKSRLVESWARQPGIQTAIVELAERNDNEASNETTLQSEPASQIQDQLAKLSGIPEVKYVIWGTNYRTLASSDPVLAATGDGVAPEQAEMLTRVLGGETVVFGPARINGAGDRSIDGADEAADAPAMAIVVPVVNDQGRVVAAFLVRGIGMFDEFSRMFFDVANAGNLDAYAVNQSGIMLTESPRAATLASMKKLDVTVEEIAARLRITDPGMPLTASNLNEVQRAVCPLTDSVASATSGSSEVRIEPYRNYAGLNVVGAWRWNSDSKLGIIVERPADAAFATVRIVRSGFLLLGSLLFVTASVAAAFLARATTAERAAVHPLSRYEVVRELGSGGMGVVYLARHRQLGRDTALKVMIGGGRRREDRLRFDREARLAASLSNPHSVMIYDYGCSEDGEAYCVMEFLRGLTLQEVVERSGPQPFGRVLFILSQVCEALAEAHDRQLLHLDIKPQNIMLSLDQPVGDWAVLFDYGLAKPVEPAVDFYQTSEAHWSGTPMYMAPERFRQPNVMDRRSDIYSLGCVAYFLFAGQPPFFDCEAESLFTLILNQTPVDLSLRRDEPVPDDLRRLVMKCMAKSPEDRFDSIHDLARAIESIQARYPWTVDQAREWWKHYGDDHSPRVPS